MTDQERLEDVKEQWKNGYPVTAGSNEEPQLHRDFEWLIEQAERAQELETYVETGTYIQRKLRKENSRYRDTLEELKFQLENVDAGGDIDYLLRIVNQGLKESE